MEKWVEVEVHLYKVLRKTNLCCATDNPFSFKSAQIPLSKATSLGIMKLLSKSPHYWVCQSSPFNEVNRAICSLNWAYPAYSEWAEK